MSSSPRYDSENTSPKPLGEPLHFEFSGKTAPNRFLKSAMAESLGSWDPKDLSARGIPTEKYINAYRRWGEGQTGTILTGNIMIDLEHINGPGDVIIPRDSGFEGERFEAFKSLAETTKRHGSLLLAQVSHPGRQSPSHIQKHPISASDVQLEGNPMGMSFEKPRAASLEDIKQIVEGFAHAAEYLYKAGFDGMELHGAHGYLIAQFLAPSTNKRTDQYGGSLENRSRIIFDIARAIHDRVPQTFILGIKINSVEFQAGGFDTNECRDLCASLEANRFDFVELSGGTYEEFGFVHKRESTRKREAFFLEFAKTITPALTKTKTFVTGGFKTVGAMVHALETVDAIGLGRVLAQEPHFSADVLAGRIQGAIKQQFEEDNFGVAMVAAGSLIQMIGNDWEPVDFSRGEVAARFLESMGAWAKAQTEGGSEVGYVRIQGGPYGVPYVY